MYLYFEGVRLAVSVNIDDYRDSIEERREAERRAKLAYLRSQMPRVLN